MSSITRYTVLSLFVLGSLGLMLHGKVGHSIVGWGGLVLAVVALIGWFAVGIKVSKKAADDL